MFKETKKANKKDTSLKVSFSLGIMNKDDTVVNDEDINIDNLNINKSGDSGSDDDSERNTDGCRDCFSQGMRQTKNKSLTPVPGKIRVDQSSKNMGRQSRSVQPWANKFVYDLYNIDDPLNPYYHGCTRETCDLLSKDWVHAHNKEEAVYKRFDLDGNDFPTLRECPNLGECFYVLVLGDVHNKIERNAYPPEDDRNRLASFVRIRVYS